MMGIASLYPPYEEIALNGTNFTLFLLAALVIAAVPGPGIFYVAARTLSGGKRAGIASTFGTALGGLVHVIAGGLGVSAIILASAELFTALKFAGALYLVWLGIKTFREARDLLPQQAVAAGTQRAFREGVLVEALNPKTAAFFLAFIPQFVDPAGGYVALQFITLGLISVALNTLADVVVVMMAATARAGLTRRPNLLQRLRQGSGLFIAGLGISLALARRPASLAQRSRMHPPSGVIAPDLLRRAAGFGGVLVDRKAGGARSGHPRQPGAVGRVERRDDLADHGLNAHGRRFQIVGAGGERFDPVFERCLPRRASGPAAARRWRRPAIRHCAGRAP